MSEQEERHQQEERHRMVRAENEEGQDDIEAHRKRAASEDVPKDDDSSEDVEAHRKKV